MHLNPSPHRGGGGDATPHEFFWNGRRAAGRIALKFCTAHGASWQKKNDRVRSGHRAITS